MFESEHRKSSSRKGKAGKTGILILIGSSGIIVLAASLFIWKHQAHAGIPPATMRDLQAARQAKHSRHHFERFLDLLYGPQTNPSNRVKAVEGFFQLDHIEALYLMVNGRTNSRMQAHIDKVARTIARYRETMSPEEKAQLGAYFESDTGRAQIRKATDFYQSKDARFRSMTAPVIKQLLTTVTAAEQAQKTPAP